MNKKTLKALTIAAFGMLAVTFNSYGNMQTFYVCDGTNFKLTASTPGGEDYEWNLIGGTITSPGTVDYATSISLASSTVAEKKVYTVRWQEVPNGCWSDYDSVTVYVLPALTATIDNPNVYFCSNDLNDTLTATSNFGSLDFSVIPSANGTVALQDFVWAPTGGTGTNNDTYYVTTTGTYEVSIKYDLSGLTVKDGDKVDCEGTDSVTISTVTTAPNAPTVTIN